LKRSQKTTNNYLIKQLPKATAFVTSQNVISFVSDKWLNDFECNSTDVIGKNIITLFKNANKEWQDAISESLKGLPSLNLSSTYRDSKGSEKWFEILSTTWYDEYENVIGTILHTEDITTRVTAETKLEKLSLISEEISDSADIGFWDYSLADDKMNWDNRTREMHQVHENYVPNFIDSINFYKLGHSRNVISMTVNKAITSEVPFSEKLQLVTAKGEEIWVITSGKPLYKNGKFSGMVGTIQNITERHLNETKTRENQHLLRTLIDNLPLNVYIKDLESRKILINQAEIDYCEVESEDDILGKDDFAIFDKKTAQRSRKDDLTVMRDLVPILSREMEHERKNGTTTTFLTSKIPLLDSDGHAYGLVGISMDISDRKKKEVELQKLIDVTSSQNEKLINFAHIVSHNLRSHGANFSMLLDFLLNENSVNEREKMTLMLKKASNHLLETIENLNEILQITTNTNLKKVRVNLKSKIAAVEKSLSVDITKNEIKLTNTVNEKVNVLVVPAYLDSILTNLISNGIKYRSPERAPSIKLSATKEGKFIVLSIKDNGLGIDLDKHGEKIFGMYKTFHGNKDAKGIGLYITKSKIEAMNGKIKVESKEDKGTTFKIYFNDKS